MKTNTLLLLASLAVLATGASAAPFQNENEVVVLPTYTVAAPRHLPLEQQINASLDEVRRSAKTPVAVSAECSALKAVLNDAAALAQKARDEKPARVAKL